MQSLVVQIENTKTQFRDKATFTRSPVRVGRNQLNDLVVNESFVSQWHAIIRFDATQIVYVDLGSTNGTTFNGQRLPKNVEATILPDSDVRIGPVRLSFSRAQHERPNTGAFGRHTVGAPEPSGFQKTLFMTMEQVQQKVEAQLSGAAPQAPAEYVPTGAEMQQLVAASEQLGPYFQAYRQAFASLLQAAQHYLAQIPAKNRPAMVGEIARRYPELIRESSFRDYLSQQQVQHPSLKVVDPNHWIERLTTGDGKLPKIPGQQDTVAAMERVGALLEVYSESFVELRKGFEQFGKDMAVQVVHEDTPLRRLDDKTELLRYLLDWNSDASERVGELKRFFGDLGLHQVALLNGITEGVRALLEAISPQQISGVQPGTLIKKGIGSVLLPWKSAGHWFQYAKRHATVMEEDRFTKEMFGRSFARAYYMITGSRVEEGLGTAQIRARTQTHRARVNQH